MHLNNFRPCRVHARISNNHLILFYIQNEVHKLCVVHREKVKISHTFNGFWSVSLLVLASRRFKKALQFKNVDIFSLNFWRGWLKFKSDFPILIELLKSQKATTNCAHRSRTQQECKNIKRRVTPSKFDYNSKWMLELIAAVAAPSHKVRAKYIVLAILHRENVYLQTNFTLWLMVFECVRTRAIAQYNSQAILDLCESFSSCSLPCYNLKRISIWEIVDATFFFFLLFS